MKRTLLITLVLAVVLPSAFLLFMRYRVVADEGYPTWEAVRNMLVRNGEVAIALPENVKLLAAQCDDSESEVSIDGQIVTTKTGYSWSTIQIEVEIEGQAYTLQFNPQKLNNWNRIRFEPINPSDPFSDFAKFENGVEKPHSATSRRAQRIFPEIQLNKWGYKTTEITKNQHSIRSLKNYGDSNIAFYARFDLSILSFNSATEAAREKEKIDSERESTILGRDKDYRRFITKGANLYTITATSNHTRLQHQPALMELIKAKLEKEKQ